MYVYDSKTATHNSIVSSCSSDQVTLKRKWDSGPIKYNECVPEINCGNFWYLLWIHIKSGLFSIIKDSQNIMLHATYLSPMIQNEIISVCGEIVQKLLVQDCNSALCFSVLADEPIDISRQKEVSNCVRYIEPKFLILKRKIFWHLFQMKTPNEVI